MIEIKMVLEAINPYKGITEGLLTIDPMSIGKVRYKGKAIAPKVL